MGRRIGYRGVGRFGYFCRGWHDIFLLVEFWDLDFRTKAHWKDKNDQKLTSHRGSPIHMARCGNQIQTVEARSKSKKPTLAASER